MSVISKAIHPQALSGFTAEVKAAYPQYKNVQFLNTSGKLQTLVNLADDLTAIQEIAERYQPVDTAVVAAADWSRIERQGRYKAAVVRNQANKLRFMR